MTCYLCYDLKGIQHYIFQVPKLKCCIGGSRQVDSFDREDAGGLSMPGCESIYTGGGKGAFSCNDTAAVNALKAALVQRAMAKGLTIRFGVSEDYSEAARNIVETYCYQPESLDGQPCRISGMYPVDTASGVSSLIQKRIVLGSAHDQKSPTEKKFLEVLRQDYPECEFFYDVDAREHGEQTADGQAGAQALGNRNRWAVVCMDGNDIGSQFLSFGKKYPWRENPDCWRNWLPAMSQKLDECTCHAAQEGMRAVAKAYFQENPGRTVLPIRPLIVGGDDVTVLVGCQYATLFVQTVTEEFRKFSQECNAKDKGIATSQDLWVGTGGELTISAGILFAPVSLPLHSALDFAEELLKSAKTRGRELREAGRPMASPSCLDWESVTEGLLSSVADRRREFCFFDKASDARFELTCRPYSLEDFRKLGKLSEEVGYLPGTMVQKLRISLFGCRAERLRFYAQIAENYPQLFKGLREPVLPGDDSYGSFWKVGTVEGKRLLRTSLMDVLLLQQEDKRMDQETVGK